MDENQRENSSNEKDDFQAEEIETSSLGDNNSTPEKIPSNPKYSHENLKRPPLHPINAPEILEDCSKYTEKEEEHYKYTKKTEKYYIHTETTTKRSKCIKIDVAKTLGSTAIFCYVVPIMICLVCVMLYKKMSINVEQDKQLNVQDLMENLRSKFDGQPSLTYRVIETALKTANSKDSDSPGIIILLSSRKSEDTTNELANWLAKLISEPQDAVLIYSKPYSPAEQFGKEIDDVIKGNLTEKQMRAVLVKNLGQIPFEAAMMFQSFCDHENAPFKRAVYVMTAFIEETIPLDSDEKEWDKLASKHLRTVWGDSEDLVKEDSKVDLLEPLITRLTVKVAAITS